jgi:hypothetical protein
MLGHLYSLVFKGIRGKLIYMLAGLGFCFSSREPRPLEVDGLKKSRTNLWTK